MNKKKKSIKDSQTQRLAQEVSNSQITDAILRRYLQRHTIFFCFITAYLPVGEEYWARLTLP